MKRSLVAFSIFVALSAPARADFSSCVASLRSDASAKGVSAATLDAAFRSLQPDMKVLDFESSQPEFKTPIWDYLAALVDDERVADGKAAMAKNAGALAEAERRFGVDRHVLAAIWGVESNFGGDMGKRPLVQSLATLACFSPQRPAYFRGELMATLKIADRGDVPLDRLTGSWAGAFGQTQFMPSTFLRLAVDLDGSGRDIVDSAAAALGSTANYLAKSGWESGEPWGFEVKLPENYSGPSGRKNKQPMSAWAARGIRRVDGRPLGDGRAGLLLPAGADGPAFLVTHNFDVIYSYNAAEVLHVGDCDPRAKAGGRPGHRHALADRRPGPVARRTPRIAAAADQARLRRRRAGRRDRRQDEGGDRRFRGQERTEGRRAGGDQGAGGAAAVGCERAKLLFAIIMIVGLLLIIFAPFLIIAWNVATLELFQRSAVGRCSRR